MNVTDGKVILLVIDNPDDVTLVRRTLARHCSGHDVILAQDGAEALKYLFGDGGGPLAGARPLPAAIVLDLKLPRVDGAEVLRRLRADERMRGLPVVVFSSPTEICDLTQAGGNQELKNLRAAGDFAQFGEAVRHLGAFLRGA
jgi:CheY-like chemotaxis protein